MSKQLDEKTVAALLNLGHTEDEVDELAEKQKAILEEENVVLKEDATTEETPERAGRIVEVLKELLGIGTKDPVPVASEPEEAEKADEVTEPESTAEPAEKQAEDAEPEAEKEQGEVLPSVLGEVIAKALGELVLPELQKRDKRIEELTAQVTSLSTSIEEKVQQRLGDLAPVVTVAPSQVAVTAVEEKPKGLTFGQTPDVAIKFAETLVSDIERVVKDKVQGVPFQL